MGTNPIHLAGWVSYIAMHAVCAIDQLIAQVWGYPDSVDSVQGLAIVSVWAGELYGHDLADAINSVLPRGSQSALTSIINIIAAGKSTHVLHSEAMHGLW